VSQCKDLAEKQEKQQEACRAQACHTGPIPSVDNNLHDIPDLVPDLDDTDCDDPGPCGGKPDTPAAPDDESIEEGDRIFATCFHNKPAEVHTTQNISQRLAEVFHKYSETKSFRDSAPDYLHDFEDVFSKTSFDELPAQKPWDHAIELIPDAQNKSCKVYPLFNLGAGAARQIPRGKPHVRSDPPLQITDGCTILLCQEKGWVTPPGTGLLSTQCDDCQK
jgi:hypothetical protein